MTSLTSQVLSLALGAAISPTILTVAVVVLSGAHGRARMVVFTAANVLVLSAIGIAGLVVFTHSAGAGPHPQQKSADAAIDAAIGLILVILGFRSLLKQPNASEQEEKPEASADPKLLRYMMVGVVMMLSNFTTLALFLPADKDIALAHVAASQRALVLAVLIVVATAAAWLPLLLTCLAPNASRPALQSVSRFTTVYRRQISVVVCFAFGAYLLVKGMSADHSHSRS